MKHKFVIKITELTSIKAENSAEHFTIVFRNSLTINKSIFQREGKIYHVKQISVSERPEQIEEALFRSQYSEPLILIPLNGNQVRMSSKRGFYMKIYHLSSK